MTRPVQSGIGNAFDNFNSSREEVEADVTDRAEAHARAVAARATIASETDAIAAALPSGVTMADVRNTSSLASALRTAEATLASARSARAPNVTESINRLRGGLAEQDREIFSTAVALGVDPEHPPEDQADYVARILRAAPAIRSAWIQAYQLQRNARTDALTRREAVATAEAAVDAASTRLHTAETLHSRAEHLADAEHDLADATADEAANQAEIEEDANQLIVDSTNALTGALGELATVNNRIESTTAERSELRGSVSSALAELGLTVEDVGTRNQTQARLDTARNNLHTLEETHSRTTRDLANATSTEGLPAAVASQVQAWFAAGMVPNITDPAQQELFNSNPAAYGAFVERYNRRARLQAQSNTETANITTTRGLVDRLQAQVTALNAQAGAYDRIRSLTSTLRDLTNDRAPIARRVADLRDTIAWARGSH